MYSVSAKYLESVQETSRGWDLYIDVVLRNGTRLKFTKNDIDLGSFIFKDGATCSDTIQIGSTYSNSVEFRITNAEGQFTEHDFYRAKVYPYVGLDLTGEENFEYVPLGEFNILDNVKKFSTISVSCFDNMGLLNQTFDFSTLVFPTLPITIFDEVINQTGIQCSEDLRNSVLELSYQVSSLLTNDPTCRDVLSGIGIMLLKNMRFDRAGVLEAFWYESHGRETTRNTRIGNSRYGDNQIVTTGVYLEDAYGNTFSVGSEEYPVELPTSPIIQGSETSQQILEQALALLQDLPYRPATITWIGDPAIQAGDILSHVGTAIGNVTLPVMRLVYKFADTETLESLGMDSSTMKQQSTTDKKLKKAFSKAAQDRSELETRIDQTANAVLIQASEEFAGKSDVADLSIKTDNISAEVSHQAGEIDGVKTSITHVQQSAEKMDIKIQKLIDDGVSSVTTTTGYTFDNEGLKIQKSGEEMENKLDNTGMYVTRSGETILQANNKGVIATDVTVRNYLIIGSHARFEDYNDGTDSKRTACFYV